MRSAKAEAVHPFLLAVYCLVLAKLLLLSGRNLEIEPFFFLVSCGFYR